MCAIQKVSLRLKIRYYDRVMLCWVLHYIFLDKESINTRGSRKDAVYPYKGVLEEAVMLGHQPLVAGPDLVVPAVPVSVPLLPSHLSSSPLAPRSSVAVSL